MEYKVVKLKVRLSTEGNSDTPAISNDVKPLTLEGYDLVHDHPSMHLDADRNYINLVFLYKKSTPFKAEFL